MPKKNWTEEEKKAFAAKMAAARAKAKEELPKQETKDAPEEIAEEQGVDELQRQIEEMKQNMDLMRAALLNNQGTQPQGISMNREGNLVGEWEKYLIDPSNYPDPTQRLAKEQRLAPLAFDYHYELEYEVGTSRYETKTGKNVAEPKFKVTLNRVVLDDQGNKTDKRYIARKMVFHEDPQAALVIAREQNLDVDKTDEKMFLNEMRYLRVRDWLFDYFWPKPVDEVGKIKEEVIGGTIVQVFTKASEDSSSIPFDQLNTKVQ